MEAYFFVWLKVFLITSVRYLLFASIVFFPCYFWFKDSIAWRRIQTKFPKAKDYVREVSYSFLTFVIFGCVAMFVHSIRAYTFLYSEINEYPIWWFWISIPVALVVHDAYFYWTHRLMHHPRLFKTMHLVHHRSTNPTPWAAFAFHPTEAVVEAGIITVLAFTVPMTFWSLMIFLVIMTIENVIGHLGYEFFPRWLTNSRIGFWLNSSTNHNQHHKYFEGNYGLYFRWWDVWMGTTHPKYYSELEQIQNRRPKPTPSAQVN